LGAKRDNHALRFFANTTPHPAQRESAGIASFDEHNAVFEWEDMKRHIKLARFAGSQCNGQIDRLGDSQRFRIEI